MTGCGWKHSASPGFLGGIGGHTMEIQIKRNPMGQAHLLDLVQPRFHQTQAHFVVNARAVGGQIGTLGNDVETGEQSDGLIQNQVHHVALPLGANQLQRQQAAYRLLGGNHLRAGQPSRRDHAADIDAMQQGHE